MINLANPDVVDSPFGSYEEEAVISLILDFPETYTSLHRFLVPNLFSNPATQFVLAAIRQDFEKYGCVPSRKLLYDRLAKSLTVEDPYESILPIIKRESNPRDVPIIRGMLRSWAEHKTYELLYSDEAINAHQNGDYSVLRKIFDDASSISSVSQQGFWLFDQLDELFVEDASEHLPTGFPDLDNVLNEGGPSPGEVLLWLAPTGVGKTLMMCNNAVTLARAGHNVMFVTFELSALKSALRMVGAISGAELDSFTMSAKKAQDARQSEAIRVRQDAVRRHVRDFKTKSRGDIVIFDLPPEECSVNDIYGLIENLRRTRSWTPKVIILDYLDLMVSRRTRSNDEDYSRQKNTATEVRGLARNTQTFVITATQTNRSGLAESQGRGGNKEGHGKPNINLEKTAESFGKAMPLDYIVSLNQDEEEYNVDPGEASIIRLWVAKNRNGRKFVSITTNVFYGRMLIKQV